MSLKIFSVGMLVCICFACAKVDKNKLQDKTSSSLNLEDVDSSSSAFKKLKIDKSFGEEYIDFSYNFEQTSLFKRHLNTIGLLIDSSNSEYIRRFSYSYKKAGEHEKAMKILNLSLESENEISAKLNNLDYAAWNYLYFYRDYENTIKTVDDILELTHNDLGISCHGEACLLLKGQALYRLGKYEEAIRVFSDYQQNETKQGFDSMDNFLIVFYKAICLSKLKQYDTAISYFSHLVEGHPSAEVSYQLAKLYYLTSDFENSKIHLLQAESALAEGFTFKEPYFERFDKVFQYQIENLKQKLE
ncbi:MAG: tetratricopeptide repeat protein [Psychroflexus sp.]